MYCDILYTFIFMIMSCIHLWSWIAFPAKSQVLDSSVFTIFPSMAASADESEILQSGAPKIANLVKTSYND